MKNLTRFGALLYFFGVCFVVYHNAGTLEGMLQARFITMILMGIIGFIVLLKVIDEATDESPDKSKKG